MAVSLPSITQSLTSEPLSRSASSSKKRRTSSEMCPTYCRIKISAGLLVISRVKDKADKPRYAQPCPITCNLSTSPSIRPPPPSGLVDGSILPLQPCLGALRCRKSAHGYSRGPHQVPQSGLQHPLVELSVELKCALVEILFGPRRRPGGRRLRQRCRQVEVREYPGHHRRLRERRNDLHLSMATRASEEIHLVSSRFILHLAQWLRRRGLPGIFSWYRGRRRAVEPVQAARRSGRKANVVEVPCRRAVRVADRL